MPKDPAWFLRIKPTPVIELLYIARLTRSNLPLI